MEPMTLKDYGISLHHRIETLGLSVTDVAIFSGIKVGTLKRILDGRIDPSISIVIRIENALKVLPQLPW